MKRSPKYELYAVEYSPSENCFEIKPLEHALQQNLKNAITYAKTPEGSKKDLRAIDCAMVFIGWRKAVAETFAKGFGNYLNRLNSATVSGSKNEANQTAALR